jgi:hypothetical protein
LPDDGEKFGYGSSKLTAHICIGAGADRSKDSCRCARSAPSRLRYPSRIEIVTVTERLGERHAGEGHALWKNFNGNHGGDPAFE